MINAQLKAAVLEFYCAGVELSPGISADYLHFETEGPKDILGQGSQKTETLVTLKSLARTPG